MAAVAFTAVFGVGNVKEKYDHKSFSYTADRSVNLSTKTTTAAFVRNMVMRAG